MRLIRDTKGNKTRTPKARLCTNGGMLDGLARTTNCAEAHHDHHTAPRPVGWGGVMILNPKRAFDPLGVKLFKEGFSVRVVLDVGSDCKVAYIACSRTTEELFESFGRCSKPQNQRTQ